MLLAEQAEHVEQLIDAINDAMPKARLSRDDIVSGYSGLYDYRTNNIKSTVYQGSGEYQIIDHQSANQVSGLVTALGAKFTTGRKVSALTMKVVNQKLKRHKLSDHKSIVKQKLSGSDYSSFEQLQRTALEQYKDQCIESYGENKILLLPKGDYLKVELGAHTHTQLQGGVYKIKKLCVIFYKS